jgi:hypothetical protein
MTDQPPPGPNVTRPNVTDPCAGQELPVEPLDPIMVAEVLEALAGRLESLESLVAAVTDQLVAAPPGGPWAWQHLGAAQTRALLKEVRDWVDWLIGRYELRGEAETIPPCWFLHPVAVEELTALMVAWKAAYSQKEIAPSEALVNWHDRWLWPTLHRLNVQLHVWAKCTGGSHAPSRPVPTCHRRRVLLGFRGRGGTPNRCHRLSLLCGRAAEPRGRRCCCPVRR